MPICFEKMLSLQKRLWKQGVKKTDKYRWEKQNICRLTKPSSNFCV